jgi:transcriptional regulator with XRE-family HTH domain
MDAAELRHTFSNRIRKLREERGLNQGQFADSVGVSRGAMSYYEQEARTPDIGVLRAICEKCGVSADYMLGIIPDQNHAISDVCRETGLYPIAARRLRLIEKLKETTLESAVTVVENFDEDAKEALELMAFTAATPMINLLLASDEGLKLLTLLSAIIFGAEFETGSDTTPYFKLMPAHKNIQIHYPVQNITAALWVNVQEEAAKLRDKLQSADDNPE